MSTLKVNEVRHLSNTGTANVTLDSNATTNLQATTTLGLTVTGTLTVSGLSTFNGNMVVGNATTDTVDLQSKVTGFNNFSGFTGEIRMYAGNEGPNAPPAGWLYCNGDTISSTSGNGGTHYNADGKGNDYEPLFNLLKTNSNWGNSGSPAWGTNTVKLPDFRSRSPVGVHTGAANSITAGLTARAIGATSGTETHTLVVAEMPQHDHGGATTSSAVVSGQALNSGAVTVSINNPTLPNHVHPMAHTHEMQNHTHALQSHTHSLTSHTHSNGDYTAATDGVHNHGNGSYNQLMRISGGSYVNTPNSWDVGGSGTEIHLTNSGTIVEHAGHTHDVTGKSSTPGDVGSLATPGSLGSLDGPSNNTTTGVSTANTTNPTSNPSISITGSGTVNTALTSTTHTHSTTVANEGGDGAHNNLSPIIAVNYIIKV